jgi:hypothetical protein
MASAKRRFCPAFCGMKPWNFTVSLWENQMIQKAEIGHKHMATASELSINSNQVRPIPPNKVQGYARISFFDTRL